ncbi:MAG: hypothetical protein HKP58_14465 [Desulfatitalea sp.]|nr:hypothetical protein [Desulfatitalea sp.]NNK01609.1 hypothetical protein [Desulfatitalea sp.]
MRLRVAAWLTILAAVMCPPASAVAADSENAGEAPVRVVFKRAAVASFLVGKQAPDVNEKMDKTLSCPMGQICTDDPSILPNAGMTLTRLVDEQLRRRFGGQVVSRTDVKNAEMQLTLDRAKDTPLAMAAQLGRLLDVEVVVIGMVWRYRDRAKVIGQPQDSASVAFAVYFIESRTGRMLWRGLFDATQQPVLDDLFQARKQLKMGLKWLSANELAAKGVQEIFQKFPQDILPGNFGDPP